MICGRAAFGIGVFDFFSMFGFGLANDMVKVCCMRGLKHNFRFFAWTLCAQNQQMTVELESGGLSLSADF